ncbi:uncharacterized protein LOC126988264 [Eriocheir sinensis]|uniref:uncharacterized protein LOC126988264 n=1 Tax=Eriocheir sinensis TaxID=95602 RepID=UPI0021C9A3D5|nr:uncharacterized protein LOC126988264 [Eriocheir sinensis]
MGAQQVPQLPSTSLQVPQLPTRPQGPWWCPSEDQAPARPPLVLASSSKQEKEAENATHKNKGVLNLLSSAAAASCPQDNTTASQGLTALPHGPGHGKGHTSASLALSGRLHQGEGVENSASRHRGVLNSASPKGSSASTMPGPAAPA